jgi:hypothetical protein
MYVLPGDQLNQQTVTLADAKQVVPFINRSAGDAGYNYRMDVLGQGTITLADAKQIVPHINDDISGLEDPTAPAASNAARLQNDAGSTVITASGSGTVEDGSSSTFIADDSTKPLMADRIASADDALAVIDPPANPSTNSATTINLRPNELTSSLGDVERSLASDRAVAVDILFGGSLDWLAAPVFPPLSIEPVHISLASISTIPALLPAAGPPPTVVLPNRSLVSFAIDDDSAEERDDPFVALAADAMLLPRRA